ncbi:fatty acyl-CoA hydrolase precursor, medium chain-like isoform X3 [Pseudophryne corroboree]|uniref:fatty acyl-CoA hydrolase precursor, medium chain-like isoform X3 n=1 Tax=Pseudophryne corroboree TaxID=495146 RepID=UPI003082165D
MGFGCIQVFVLGLFTGAVLGTAPEDERPLVGTQYGKLRGVTVAVKETSRTVDAFFGIPFAKPPLRFESPEPPVPWDSIRDASEYPPVCLQPRDSVEEWIKMYKTPFELPPLSEDCLYLNVFTPTDRARNSPLPVLSPLSKGLFHRAIAESGAMTMSVLVASKDEDLIFYRNLVAHHSGCDPASVAECLKSKSEEELLSIVTQTGFLPFPVSVDGVFLPKTAEEILVGKESNKVPFLLGVNSQEFGWTLPQMFKMTSVTKKIHRELLPSALGSIPMLGLNSSGIPFVMEEFFGGTSDPSELRDRLLDACGDVMFVIPVLKAAKYHRDSGLPVYFYEFQHRSSMFQDTKPDFVKADHTDELIYVMGGPYLRNGVVFAGDATDEEKALSRTIMGYWANFARNGDPNGPGLVKWALYNIDEGYLEINKKQKSSKRLKEDKFKFWTEILNEKIRALSGERGDHTEL